MLQYPEYAALIIKLPLATNNNSRSTKNILKAISSLQNNVVSIYKKQTQRNQCFFRYLLGHKNYTIN